MSNFDQAFDRLLGHEGAYSNNPADPGGETMWGVTVAVARRSGYPGPMRDMPVAVAKAIYRARYWDDPGIVNLPAGVRWAVFDGAVNSGPVQSIKWLQRALAVADDGALGPLTLKAAGLIPAASLVAHYNGQRLKFMTDLPTWGTFGKGWARRIASNLMEA